MPAPTRTNKGGRSHAVDRPHPARGTTSVICPHAARHAQAKQLAPASRRARKGPQGSSAADRWRDPSRERSWSSPGSVFLSGRDAPGRLGWRATPWRRRRPDRLLGKGPARTVWRTPSVVLLISRHVRARGPCPLRRCNGSRSRRSRRALRRRASWHSEDGGSDRSPGQDICDTGFAHAACARRPRGRVSDALRVPMGTLGHDRLRTRAECYGRSARTAKARAHQACGQRYRHRI